LAWGDAKASITARTVEGPTTDAIPATYLQTHDNCRFCIDKAAASQLTRENQPWRAGRIQWTDAVIRKAVLWLALKTKKPILKLVDEDYTENGMSDLLIEQGSAYNLNIRLFNITQHTITGWPGGKPNADDTSRPERAEPFPKRSLILSPEPLDDVRFLGGTIKRLESQGNDVAIVYQTSGSLAVPDSEVRRSLEQMIEFEAERGSGADLEYLKKIEQQLDDKGDFGADTNDIRHLKALIRRSEARSSARALGIKVSQLSFLDLPFYEKGRYRGFVDHMKALLEKTKPHQIFATGFGHDPLSISGLCFELIQTALKQCGASSWLKECRVWLYRGSDQEWEPHEIDMAVPLSPDELENKIQGIFQHQTQRNQSPSNRKRTRNAWDLARETNHNTASTYDALGMAEYEAIECFRRLEFER